MLIVDDIYEEYDAFSCVLFRIYSETIPISRIISHTKDTKSWLAGRSIISIKTKNKLDSKYLKHQDQNNSNTYKKYKNKLSHLLRIAALSSSICSIGPMESNVVQIQAL